MLRWSFLVAASAHVLGLLLDRPLPWSGTVALAVLCWCACSVPARAGARDMMLRVGLFALTGLAALVDAAGCGVGWPLGLGDPILGWPGTAEAGLLLLAAYGLAGALFVPPAAAWWRFAGFGGVLVVAGMAAAGILREEPRYPAYPAWPVEALDADSVARGVPPTPGLRFDSTIAVSVERSSTTYAEPAATRPWTDFWTAPFSWEQAAPGLVTALCFVALAALVGRLTPPPEPPLPPITERG